MTEWESKLDVEYLPNVVVDTSGLTEEEWLEYRRKGIGGSDVSKLLGVSNFATARDLYYDKIGVKSVIDSDNNWVAKKVGHLLEPLVAEIYAKRTGNRILKVSKMFSHPYFPFMLADLDYFFITPENEMGVLEIKTSHYQNQFQWTDDKIPYVYQLQGRRYMSVMNLFRTDFACLFSNNEKDFVIRQMPRDLRLEAKQIEAVKAFWFHHVQAKVPPPYTEKADLCLKSIERYSGEENPEKEPILLTPSLAKNLNEITLLEQKKSKIATKKRELEKEIREIESEIKKLYVPLAEEMGNATEAVCGSDFKIKYLSNRKPSMNKEALEKMKLCDPELYEKYVSMTGSRKFSLEVSEVVRNL